MARRDLVLVGVNCERDLHEALERFATEHDVSNSEAARLLLRVALEGEGAELVDRALRDVGYQSGFRRGRQDWYEHMAKLKPRSSE